MRTAGELPTAGAPRRWFARPQPGRAPHPDDNGVVGCIPVTDRRIVLIDPTHGAAHLLDDDVGMWGGDRGILLHQEVDGIVTQLRQKVRFPVVAHPWGVEVLY